MTLRAVTVQDFDREMSAREGGRYSNPDYVPELLRTFSELPEAEKEGYRKRLRVLKTGQEGQGI
jgi:hypothetical protein